MSTHENPQKWVNFHVHSDYSPQDALTSIPQIVQAAVDDGSPAATVTDHGTLGGTWKLAAEAKKAGIKACLGEELYVAIGEVDEVDARKEKNWVTDTTEDTGDKTKRYHHLTALAATAEGWQNLVTINNDANINGFWHKARTDMAFLAEHAKGLVLGTGCLGSPVNFALANGDYDKAREIVGAMRDMVDTPDHLFVEVMEHGIAKEARTRADLIRIAKDMNLRVVATNDSHYAKAEDRTAHDMWLAIDSGKPLSDPNRFRFSGERDANGVAMGYHLRTAAEMHRIFDRIAGCEDAVTNSLAVAELFDDNVLPERRLRLPKFPIPEEFATAWAANPGQFKSVESAYLYERVAKGAIERWGSPLPPHVKEQLRFEFDVIESMDVAGYFLMTEDFLKWAHSQGIRTGPGRGSAAGSAVSYSLDIVGIDPLEYGLLFERFLDVTRVGLPDIDNDIEQAHQKAVIAYLAQRYGQDRVARIGSYGTAKTKSSIKDVSRILGHYDIGEKLSKAVGGADVSFADLLDPDKSIGEDFRGLMEADPTAKKIVETALPFDGTHTRPGIHACGVLVSPEPLNTMVPLRRDTKSGAMVTEWNDKDVEDFGLTKVDILGLRNLDTITATTEQMRRSGIEVPDLDYTGIPMDPKTDERAAKAWALIGEGRTAGLFQLESSGMTKLAMQVQPTNMEDLSALVALFRPGPLGEGMHERYAARKHGLEPISYDYLTTNPAEQEVIASVLGPTHAVVCIAEGEKVYSATRGRMVPIEDVEVGELVQGVDKNGVHQLAPVTWSGITKTNAPVVRLSMAGGHSIRLTANHQVYTARGWVEARDLKADDVVAAPWTLLKTGDKPDSAPDVQEGRLLGFLLGDGSYVQRGTPVFINNDHDIAAGFKSAVTSCFPGHTVTKIKGGKTQSWRVSTNTPRGGDGGSKPSRMLRWLRELGMKDSAGKGQHSRDKRIPESWVSRTDDPALALIAALWDCDGRIRSTSPNRGMSYKTISKQLVEDLRFMLLRIGVTTSVTACPYQNPSGTTETAYHLSVHEPQHLARLIAPFLSSNGKLAEATTLSTGEVMTCHSARGSRVPVELVKAELRSAGVSVRRATQEVGREGRILRGLTAGAETVSRLARSYESVGMTRLASSRWLPVVSVVDDGVADVYDLTVDGVHSFVAEGIVVHNCYQEQLMALSGLVAGFGPGNKNRLRKAFSKKKKEEMDALYAEFMAGAVVATEDGPDSTASIAFSRQTADNLWKTFDASASYLFNKCVSGDTEVLTAAGASKGSDTWTVERLFFRLYGNDDADPALCPFCEERPRPKQVAMCARCASWQTKFRDSRGFHLLAHDRADGRIRPQRVADVHHNGTREVFTVTTGSGREITMTANHRMLTPAGYRRCDELSVGDELLSHEGFEPHGQGHLVGVDTIVSIAPAGECATYDVEMAEGTDHNFVANGLISHNSHSVSYGFVSYVTAFLKANWPEHFAAGLLSVTDSDEKRLGVLAGLRADGITLLGPDVNVGPEATGVDDDGNIRLGLSEVKGVGVNAAAIVAEREAGGPFNSLSDLVNRVKVTTARPSEDKTEVRSVSTNVCHGCAGLIVTDDTDDDDLATFEACQCQTPAVEPVEGAEAAVRESQLPGGVSVEVKLVKAGQAYKLRRTERQPVLDAEGNPVMAESNLSLGIVEALVESGACDGLGPRRGQVAVLRALRDTAGNPNPPVVPDMEWGVVERSTRERARLGAVVTDHPLKALAPKLKAWSPDIGRGARPVQIHRLPDYGYAVTIGVLAAWNERGYNGGRMVNFTLEGSQATINGVMWDRALSRLKKTGVEPQVGDVVAINASIRTSNRKDAESVLGSDGENLDMDSTEDLSLDSSLDVTTDGGVAAAAVSEADELRLRMSRLELTAYDVVVFGEDTGARVALPKPDPVKVAARKIAEAVIGPVPEPSGESAEAEQTEEPPCDPEDFEPPPDVAESVTEPVTTTEPEVDAVDGWTLCESKTTYDLEVGPDSQFRMTFKDRPRSTSSWQAPMKERHLRPKALRPIQLWLSGQAKPGEVFDQRLTTEGGHIFTFRLSPEVKELAPRDNVS